MIKFYTPDKRKKQHAFIVFKQWHPVHRKYFPSAVSLCGHVKVGFDPPDEDRDPKLCAKCRKKIGNVL